VAVVGLGLLQFDAGRLGSGEAAGSSMMRFVGCTKFAAEVDIHWFQLAARRANKKNQFLTKRRNCMEEQSERAGRSATLATSDGEDESFGR
jgi:hypothetical protein